VEIRDWGMKMEKKKFGERNIGGICTDSMARTIQAGFRVKAYD
jgi:hypothetical protein